MGAIQPPEAFTAKYGVDATLFVDELPAFLEQHPAVAAHTAAEGAAGAEGAAAEGAAAKGAAAVAGAAGVTKLRRCKSGGDVAVVRDDSGSLVGATARATDSDPVLMA